VKIQPQWVVMPGKQINNNKLLLSCKFNNVNNFVTSAKYKVETARR
jgi:hypothetical protein